MLVRIGHLRKLIREHLTEAPLGLSFGQISYTALILDEESHQRLANFAPEGWKIYAHHMTLIGPAHQKHRIPARWLNTKSCVQVTGIAVNDRVMTGLVDTGDVLMPYKGPEFLHVTIATNPEEGGKPVHSNEFQHSDFEPIDPITICGLIDEVPR